MPALLAVVPVILLPLLGSCWPGRIVAGPQHPASCWSAQGITGQRWAARPVLAGPGRAGYAIPMSQPDEGKPMARVGRSMASEGNSHRKWMTAIALLCLLVGFLVWHLWLEDFLEEPLWPGEIESALAKQPTTLVTLYDLLSQETTREIPLPTQRSIDFYSQLFFASDPSIPYIYRWYDPTSNYGDIAHVMVVEGCRGGMSSRSKQYSILLNSEQRIIGWATWE